jgi:hypothetical protein
MKRIFGFFIAALVLAAGIVGASVSPVLLKNFAELRIALEEGRNVRAVFHYKRMELFVDGKKTSDVPDAVGGMDVGAFEYFAAGAVGNPEGFLSFSHLQVIKHPKYGTVQNYVKVSVFESGRVRILAQYLAPGTFEVKMDEYFESAINDGLNQAGAHFFREGEGL